jgi:hypothetical protein
MNLTIAAILAGLALLSSALSPILYGYITTARFRRETKDREERETDKIRTAAIEEGRRMETAEKERRSLDNAWYRIRKIECDLKAAADIQKEQTAETNAKLDTLIELVKRMEIEFSRRLEKVENKVEKHLEAAE